MAAAAAGGLRPPGSASLILYDVSTLYFETDQGDGFREPGFSKERRLEPQITTATPSRSRPDGKRSPLPILSPTTSAKPSKPSTAAGEMRTSGSQRGSR